MPNQSLPWGLASAVLPRMDMGALALGIYRHFMPLVRCRSSRTTCTLPPASRTATSRPPSRGTMSSRTASSEPVPCLIGSGEPTFCRACQGACKTLSSWLTIVWRVRCAFGGVRMEFLSCHWATMLLLCNKFFKEVSRGACVYLLDISSTKGI